MSVTFTKLFSSITESTIWCEDSETRIVWITMLAMADRRGRVWGSIPGIANRARVSLEKAELAINKFLQPDAYSRSNTYDPSTEGRRIEVIEGGWRLINHGHYRNLRDEEERKEYLRVKQAERRARIRQQSQQLSTSVISGQHSAEADTDAEANKSKARALRAFTPPSLEEVASYCKERNNEVDADKFHAYYTSQGWYVGKNQMKDWRAAVRNWERNNYGAPFQGGYQNPKAAVGRQEYDTSGNKALVDAIKQGKNW